MLAEGRAGQVTVTDGAPRELRLSRLGDLVVAEGHGRYYELARLGLVYSLTLTATSTGVAAGNIIGAAAAAATQFALINTSTDRNLELLKFGMGVVSGTPGPGPVFHGYIPGATSISAASAGGTVQGGLLGQTGSSKVKPWALAAGSALTGGQAPVTHRIANFASTGTAQASVGELNAIELIEGDLIVPPGVAWLPLWGAAGTALLNGYSITWAEIPI